MKLFATGMPTSLGTQTISQRLQLPNVITSRILLDFIKVTLVADSKLLPSTR